MSCMICVTSLRHLKTREMEHFTGGQQRGRNSWMCHNEKCIVRPTIVQTYNCERGTFRLSFCLLCSTNKHPLEAVLWPAQRTFFSQRTTNPFCLITVTCKRSEWRWRDAKTSENECVLWELLLWNKNRLFPSTCQPWVYFVHHTLVFSDSRIIRKLCHKNMKIKTHGFQMA